MMKKVIITGATGMVGKGVLLECLDHPDISDVLLISRRSLDITHQKLHELIHNDWSNFKDVSQKLKGYDACFHCMGISAVGLSKEAYTEVTFNYTMALARVLYQLNPEMVFNYVSGAGTDSSEKGRTMWARVKGKTENNLLKFGFSDTYMFRPGAIIPLRGIKSGTRIYQFMYDYFMWLIKLMKVIAPNSIVNTTQLGQAMIQSVLKGYEQKILDPKDIIALSQAFRSK